MPSAHLPTQCWQAVVVAPQHTQQTRVPLRISMQTGTLLVLPQDKSVHVTAIQEVLQVRAKAASQQELAFLYELLAPQLSLHQGV